ncbi:t1/st2 receptor binding protein, putative [Pediculus humanus corporis]|uniref:T1/st2 receptor binding protein, putative n=1 Tax=Pediculus humanus subsp. corporis TaxID=121224 RepID=E0VAK8_PEDHC|nr:t1/st2 receptor binding protein, putative [Pediculus humanus corporis]EEB10414.1 t1/st2 receptor binding protein, putative [Pediculus humanus corporis]
MKPFNNNNIIINYNLFLFSFINFFFKWVSCEKDITISVGPGSKECFYQTLKIDQVLDIDYQVIDGGQGALDISFYLMAPDNRIINSVKKVKSHLLKIRHLQESFRAFATRDKNILEGNVSKINSWSLFQILIMLSVVMVKSLFDEKSKFHKIWKKIES